VQPVYRQQQHMPDPATWVAGHLPVDGGGR
jgi:hypothetical protein